MKNPVPWGKANVRLVILGCFKRGDEKIKEVLERLFLLVSDEEWINKLAGSKCYEEFITYLREFDGGVPMLTDILTKGRSPAGCGKDLQHRRR